MAVNHIKIKRGLDLPIAGAPDQTLIDAPEISQVALVGPDYHGMRPTMLVKEGDRVKIGQALFEDKKNPGVHFTSPGAGRVQSVSRGAKRVFQAVVVDLDGDDEVEFAVVDRAHASEEQIRSALLESGMWTAFRTRPHSRIPTVDSVANSIFVTAIDTNPLAADPAVVVRAYPDDFAAGVQALTTLTTGEVYICQSKGAGFGVNGRSQTVEFEGPHPAGLVGTHIHFLDPVGSAKTVWHINYQDVIGIGKLLRTGRYWIERVIALGGPAVQQPRLLRSRLGARISDLVAGGMTTGDNRVVSGSVLSGRIAEAPFDFLGRYHVQISVLPEGRQREFLGWQKPGSDKFSIKNVFAAKLQRNRLFDFSTSTGGSPRAMVPIGSYEAVMPLDIIPTFLLRSLIVGDTDQAQALGCLELDEEDLALCTFVCPGKYEYASLLRQNLQRIEKEG